MLDNQILVMDGAMGTMIQGFKLEEDDFRGERFADHESSLKGNNELLSISRPDVIKSIHLDFLKAGANILETNTFNGNRISQSDYNLQDAVREINLASVKAAREAVAEFQEANPDQPCFIAGALGPLNRTCSLSQNSLMPCLTAVSISCFSKRPLTP